MNAFSVLRNGFLNAGPVRHVRIMREEIMNIFLKQSKIKNYFLPVFLGFVILASSIPFISKYHYNWDSVNYGLALKEYNVGALQPHPPGYPVFIAAGKAVDFFVNNTNLSLIIVIILLSILSVIIYYYLALYMFDDIPSAFINALFLVSCPVFWFYREVALTYIVDLMASVISLFFVFKIIYEKKNIHLYLLAFSIGVISGFRPSMLLLVAPQLLYAFIIILINDKKENHEFDFKKIFVSAIIFLTTIALWLIPVCISAGGLQNYLSSLSGTYLSFARFTSVVYGAPWKNNLMQIRMVNRSLMSGIFGIIIPLAAGIFCLIRYYVTKNGNRMLAADSRLNHFAPVVLLSIIPASLFFYFVHFGQPGYILMIIPPLYLVSVIGMKIMFNNNIFKSLLIILLIVHVDLFLVLSPRARSVTTFDAATGIEKMIARQNNLFPYFTAQQVKHNDKQLEIVFHEVNKFLLDNSLSRDDVYIICPVGLTYEYKGNVLTNDNLWRHFNYYEPGLDSINLVPGNSIGNADPGDSNIYIKPDRKKLIITADKINDSDVPQGLALKKLNRIYAADLSSVSSFTFYGHNFIRRR